MIGWLAAGIAVYYVGTKLLERLAPFAPPASAPATDRKDGEAVPTPKAPPGPSQGRPESSGGPRVYRSKLDNVAVDASGWVPLPSGGWVTALPLVDQAQRLPSGEPIFARLSQPEAEQASAALGGRLLTRAQVDECARIGFWTKPCTLVKTKADFALMQSLAFIMRHDECMRAQLAGWNPKDGKPALGGKDYIVRESGERTDRQLEYGWSKSPGKPDMIQPPGQSHELSYTDYSQLTRAWRV